MSPSWRGPFNKWMGWLVAADQSVNLSCKLQLMKLLRSWRVPTCYLYTYLSIPSLYWSYCFFCICLSLSLSLILYLFLQRVKKNTFIKKLCSKYHYKRRQKADTQLKRFMDSSRNYKQFIASPCHTLRKKVLFEGIVVIKWFNTIETASNATNTDSYGWKIFSTYFLC